MFKILKILFPVLVVCFSLSKTVISADDLRGLLPDAPEGWTKSEGIQVYNRQNIFDYIDGGAELYLAYDFQQVSVQKYVPKSQDSAEEKTITVEIWQMKTAEDAYGVFSLDQEGEKVKIGQIGVYDAGYLRFWKSGYVIKILQMVESSKDTILQLGREIDRKIKREGELPPLVMQVPTDSLLTNSVFFFHKQIVLNNLYPISDQNKLNLNDQTDGVIADFRVCDDHLKLVLIRYPDSTNTEAVEKSLKEPYLAKGGSIEDKIFMSHEKGLQGMIASGNYLIIVFNGKDKLNVLWLLTEATDSLGGKKTEIEPRCFRYR
jgi:hypothetical protein